MASTATRQKVVIVGDGACGKTCLLLRFKNQTFDPDAYIPTVFENYVADLTLSTGQRIELALWDTAGQDDWDRLRPLSYPDSDVIVIAYSVDLPDSLENVRDKWYPEVRHYCPKLPVVLVALKKDLRNDERTLQRLLNEGGYRPITEEQGRLLAGELKMNAFLECSSKTGEGVKQVFEKASRLVMEDRAGSGGEGDGCCGCTIL